MSQRLVARLEQERLAGRKLFIPFVTAGDRGLEFTRRAVLALAEAGADAVELGVPFSDPLADGRVIQKASERALSRGTNLLKIYQLVAELRKQIDLPVILMGYFNPFLRLGLENAALLGSQTGVDGFIIPDLPPEEAGEWIKICRPLGLDTIFLIAPTSTRDRVLAVAKSSSGYIYYVSVTGITGMRSQVPSDLVQGIKRIRRLTSKPVLVGFGISNPNQAKQISRLADGVIVGSALVKRLESNQSDGKVLADFKRFARQLAQAIKK